MMVACGPTGVSFATASGSNAVGSQNCSLITHYLKKQAHSAGKLNILRFCI